MTEIQSYSFYPNKEVDLFGKTVIIEPYRTVEIADYMTPIEEARNNVIKFQFQAAKERKKRQKTGKKEKGEDKDNKEESSAWDNVSDEDFELYQSKRKEEERLEEELFQAVYDMAQLGLKRALYPEAKDLIGEELNKFPHIDAPKFKIYEIFRTMDDLATGKYLDEIEVDDTKNEKTSTQKNTLEASKEPSSE